jgi:hypothetical protein
VPLRKGKINIFPTDSCPHLSATNLCDQHVTKMLVEYAQILWTSLRRWGYVGEGYKEAYPRHPSTIWAGNTRSNYLWLCKHAISTAVEYSHRYDKPPQAHKSVKLILRARSLSKHIPEGDLERFSIAIAPTTKAYRFVDVLRPVHSYRIYYALDKAPWATWTNREPPDWLERYKKTYDY